MNYICSQCGKKESVHILRPNCACGGLWKLDFSPPKFSLAEIDRDEWSLFRYRKFMPVSGDAWRSVSLGEGMTPVIRLDKDVLLKMDYFMPTLSYKDRGAVMLITRCKELGVDYVVQDSSGNAGNSIAAYAARAGIRCEIFVPEGTSPKKIDMIRAYGAKCTVVPGNRDHCADICREKVKRDGLYYANHVYNPFFYEGTKTYIYEVMEQIHRMPNLILIPVGNGTLFLGAIVALEHLLESGLINRIPKIIAVQSENCDPLLKAALNGEECPAQIIPQPTIAEGIAIGKPRRGAEILAYASKYEVEFIHAPENKILEARNILAKKGVYCEHTTAANYAAYLHYRERQGAAEDCLITMCGAGLKSDH